MVDSSKQLMTIKFWFLFRKFDTETLEMLQTAYKDEATEKTQVFEWYSHFKRSEMSINDKSRYVH